MLSLNKNSKKFVPVSLKRQKARRRNKIIFLLLLPVFAVGFYFVFANAAKWAADFKAPAWTDWHLKTVKIATPSKEAARAAAKYINFKAGASVKHDEAENLETLLRANLKEMKKITVRRNFFNGELKITLLPRKPLAALNQDGRVLFIDEEGVIFPMQTQPAGQDILVLNINGEIKDDLLPQELVKLLKALNNARALDLNDIQVDAQKREFSFTAAGGARVYMGSFKGAEDKLGLVQPMLKAAKSRKLSAPYEINFTYFDDGKVYLKSS